MTVISSVYKDDDVKCHTSRADPPGERPASFRSVVQSHVSQTHGAFCPLLCFGILSSLSVYFPPVSVILVVVVYFKQKKKTLKKNLWISVCMLRHLVVVANRRITIYLYLYHTHTNKNKQKKITKTCPEPENPGEIKL